MQLKRGIVILRSWWNRFVRSEYGQQFLKAARFLFLGSILSYLGYKLISIGWIEVWESLPTRPMFYILFPILFFSVPLIQVLIYRLTWKFDVWRNFPVFIKKRILNAEVIGYSGEFYFFSWARKNIDLPEINIMERIRDYNILSAAASNTTTIILLGIFTYYGKAKLTDLLGRPDPVYFVVGGVALLILVSLIVRFRQYIFSTPMKMSLTVYGLHLFRMLIGQVLQIAMWAVVLPSVSLETWFTYAAVSILISRIPVSNKKLIFVGVGVEISTGLGIPEAAMFGLLASIAALEKVFSFGFFLLLSLMQRTTYFEDALSMDKLVKQEIKPGKSISQKPGE